MGATVKPRMFARPALPPASAVSAIPPRPDRTPDVAYVSLYRKYRPQVFDEVVGQDHVVRTLTQAVQDDRLHHAYLFTGPRGTGKTSTARILAKAVNCEQGPTASPCNVCAQCVGITNGSSVDVIEIDAASHGGVDDVRDLRDRVAFSPASARMKVYIVDECHMLSTAGWNAFLKTVEEPPGHVLFVFATTEPHKVLATILSRTQRFDFKRVTADVLAGHVRDLCARESVQIEPEAVEMVVRAGDGSVRDTLSVLDQVVAFTGAAVSAAAVADVLGMTPADLLGRAADALAARDVAGVMTLVQDMADGGADPRQFARDLVEHLRALFLLQVAPDGGLGEGTPERVAELRAQAGRFGRNELLRAVDLLAEAQSVMRRGNTRLPLELALAKAAMPEHAGDPAALAARLERLESAEGAEREPEAVPQPERVQVPPDVAVVAPDRAAPEAGLGELLRQWDAVLDAVKNRSRRVHAMLQMGRPLSLTDTALTLEFPGGYSVHADTCAEHGELIGAAVAEFIGTAPAIRTVVGVGEAPAAPVDDEPEATAREAAEVAETEQAERDGTLPDDAEAETLALQTLTRELGATVLDEGA
jgi:DNA polymerase-3 subunit gamma/tau